MDTERAAGLGVGETEHVDRDEQLAHRLGKRRDSLQDEICLRRQLGLRVAARCGDRDIVELGSDLRTAGRAASRIEVGVVQSPVEVAEVVVAAYEAWTAEYALIRVLDQVL